MEKLLHRIGLGEWADILDNPLRILLVLLVAWVLLRVARGLGGRVLRIVIERQGDQTNKARRIETVTRIMNYVLTVVVSVVAFVMILAEFGISIAPLLATAGIAGVAIGFGTQSLVKDYFTGLVLLIENQIRIGDFVELAGKSGTVEEVTLRYIRLRDYAGVVHFVPNGTISMVSNHTRDFAHAVIDAAIGYGHDTDTVFEMLRRIGAELREDEGYRGKILGDLELAGVESLGDNSVNIRCRIKVKPGEPAAVRREFLRRIKKTFDREGIEIPFPQLNVHMNANQATEPAAGRSD